MEPFESKCRSEGASGLVSGRTGEEMEWISKVLGLFQHSTKYVLAVAVASGVFLALPTEWLAQLGLDQLDANRGYVGIAFLLSVFLLFAEVLLRCWLLIQTANERRKSRSEIASAISELDRSERQFLRQFLRQGCNTQRVACHNQTVSALMDSGILQFVDNADREGIFF